jgi:hypothetical protein
MTGGGICIPLQPAECGNLPTRKIKNFPIRDSMKLQFRAEFFNAFNRPQLGTPDGTITSFDLNQLGTFGTISNTIADNHDIQFGLKLVFLNTIPPRAFRGARTSTCD